MDAVNDHDLIRQFERDGVVCVRNVVTPTEIKQLREAVGRQMESLGASPTAYDLSDVARQVFEGHNRVQTGSADRLDFTGLSDHVLSDGEARPMLESGEGHGGFFYDAAGWKTYEEIRNVALDSALPELAASLLRSRTLHFWEDTTFVKPPRTPQKTVFHQDLAYFQIKGEQCVIIWIALDHADLSNGVVEYVRGSHRWSETYAASVFFAQTPRRGSDLTRLPDIEAEREKYDIVAFDVEPGDVLIHHVRTVHGAGGNMSDRMRRGISFRYCGDDVRYFDRPGAVPQYGVTHALEDGDHLFHADYPVVWPRPWPNLKLSPLYPTDSLVRTAAA